MRGAAWRTDSRCSALSALRSARPHSWPDIVSCCRELSEVQEKPAESSTLGSPGGGGRSRMRALAWQHTLSVRSAPAAAHAASQRCSCTSSSCPSASAIWRCLVQRSTKWSSCTAVAWRASQPAKLERLDLASSQPWASGANSQVKRTIEMRSGKWQAACQERQTSTAPDDLQQWRAGAFSRFAGAAGQVLRPYIAKWALFMAQNPRNSAPLLQREVLQHPHEQFLRQIHVTLPLAHAERPQRWVALLCQQCASRPS